MYEKGKKLQNKVAIITGGASGIGEAVAKIFAANECKIALVDIDQNRLEKILLEIKSDYHHDVIAFNSDVTDEQAVLDFFKQTYEKRIFQKNS